MAPTELPAQEARERLNRLNQETDRITSRITQRYCDAGGLHKLPAEAQAPFLVALALTDNANTLLHDMTLSKDLFADGIDTSAKASFQDHSAQLSCKTNHPGLAYVENLLNSGIDDKAVFAYLSETAATLLSAAEELISLADAKLIEGEKACQSDGSCTDEGCPIKHRAETDEAQD